MRNKKAILYSVTATMLFVANIRANGDDASCVIVSAGAQSEATPNAIYNVGQVAIGTTSGGVVVMHVGGIHCLSAGVVQCLKGDVDDNGLINGNDIDDYVMVTLTGMGTAQELCAADIEIDQFVALMLGN